MEIAQIYIICTRVRRTATYNPILLLIALVSGVLFSSCVGDELRPDVGRQPIVFASVQNEQETVTRAATTLGHDFVVYGYKRLANEQQAVFDGYTIRYDAGSANSSVDNTHNYNYVWGEQTMKYWDFAASEYHFWGVWAATADRARFSGDDSNVVTIPDVPLRVGEPAPEDDVLYSQLVVRSPVSAEVVRLAFNRPYAKVCIQFYTSDDIDSSGDNIELTGISLSPDPSAVAPQVNKVYGKGDVVVTYPLVMDDCGGDAHESVTVERLEMPQDALTFDAVTLTPQNGGSVSTAVTAPVSVPEAVGKKYFYYPLPMGEKNPNFILRLTINGDAEPKTAIVPAAFMHWKPNVLYSYIFKVSGLNKKVELYDVKVDPWHYGGSQEGVWKDW